MDFVSRGACVASRGGQRHNAIEDALRGARETSDCRGGLRCLGAESRWENGEIWTETRFEVVEQDKGQLPNVVTVRMLGGSVGPLHSRIDGVPTFYPGEEAYVFLWNHEGEPFRILGWSQGTFRIAKDARTGLETVTQDSTAAPIFDPRTRQFRQGGIRKLPVAIFQLKLRKALQEETP